MSIDTDRRSFICKTIGYGLFAVIGGYFPSRKSLAMGSKDYPQGMRKIEGTVRINDAEAQIGAMLRVGDIITTGAASLAIFVMGKEVYMLRDKTRLELGSDASEKFKESAVNVLRLINGKMMAVFRNSSKRLETPTAVAGVRGTGFYAEAEADRSYLCLCYGTGELHSKTRPDQREHLVSRHHNMPRYIYAVGQKLIEKAGESAHPNHTDDELRLLESFVGRTPPFEKPEDYGGKGGGGY